MPESTPKSQQDILSDINAMHDSVAVIDECISGGTHTDECHASISRNTKHLEIKLVDTDIAGSGEQLDVFDQAIQNGNDYITQ